MRPCLQGIALATFFIAALSNCQGCLSTTTSPDAGEASTKDAGPLGPNPSAAPEPNPFDPNNSAKDSDCDGLSDAEEFSTHYSNGKSTSPSQADSDGDGLLDGLELGRTTSNEVRCASFRGDADPSTTTFPTEADSDADGLADGVEDADHDGAMGPHELNPKNPDSDGDSLRDGDEDVNGNQVVDASETNPRLRDTDGDTMGDGLEQKVTHTDPLNRDTDGDGCTDGEEDLNQNGVLDVGETDPRLGSDCGPLLFTDADDDGLPDVIEDANHNGFWDSNETRRDHPDTDGDGLSDGLEDRNKNGRQEMGETSPLRRDSDCDGLIDGPDNATYKGEDLNANGLLEALETSPTVADTDQDGLPDGVERGVTLKADSLCQAFTPDLNPTSKTDPRQRDSDGDGIDDGAEDSNQNGRVDSGELNPNDASDGQGPVAQACRASSLRPVTFRAEGGPDLHLGLPASFTELHSMVVGGLNRGVVGFDPSSKVAFVAFRAPASGYSTTAIGDELWLRNRIQSTGALSNVTTQSFTTWDNFSAVQAFYEQASSVDVKVQANLLAEALVGPGAGALVGTAGQFGPFQLQAEYVHRSFKSVVVVLALVPKSMYVEPGIFAVSDTAGGSSLAQFVDAHFVQCERFSPQDAKVDFLFVVDDSCSMAASQSALADTAQAMQTRLNNSGLDWRIAMATSSYYAGVNVIGKNFNFLRNFTRNTNEFVAWLTENSTCSGGNCTLVPASASCGGGLFDGSNGGCWVGASGLGTEQILQSARRAINNLTPTTPLEQVDKIRDGAKLVVILLGDADDQSAYSVDEFIAYFNDLGSAVGIDRNPLLQPITVNGIICPLGMLCNAEPNDDRHGELIAATQGVRGSIDDSASIVKAMSAIVDAAIASAGHRMQKPPIGATVKVSLSSVANPGQCSAADLPRSRLHGFDFNGVNQTISFFGACRPSGTGVQAAVSYQYWADLSSNPNGNPPPCANDPYYDAAQTDFCKGPRVCNQGTNLCECPSDCGGGGPLGKVCNASLAVCDFVCTADCAGACTGYQTCDVTSCSCLCEQSATCAPGYKFDRSAGKCGCVCDTQALQCGRGFEADSASCSCRCQADCGGCPEGRECSPSLCTCGGFIK